MEKKLTTLPKYFVIRWDGTNPLWDEFIDWLNVTYKDELVGSQQLRFYGVNDFIVLHTHYVPNGCILLTLEQWNELVNGAKEVAQPKDQLQGKIKLRVDILGNGSMLNEIVGMVANGNQGKCTIDIDVIKSYLKAQKQHFSLLMRNVSWKRESAEELLISDDNGQSYYLVVREIVLHELTGCPTMDRQGILDEELHEIIN